MSAEFPRTSRISAREKFTRRQIEHAWRMAAYHRARDDLDSAWTFENWAWDAEIELEARKGGRA